MDDELIEVQVAAIEPVPGSVWTGWGVDPAGRNILFAGEPRHMDAIREALEAGEDVVAAVPTWAILRMTKVPVTPSTDGAHASTTSD